MKYVNYCVISNRQHLNAVTLWASRSVCLWVFHRASIHQNTIVTASTGSPLSVWWPNGRMQTDLEKSVSLFTIFWGRPTHSQWTQEPTQSPSEWTHSLRENSDFGKPFGQRLGGAERANVQTRTTYTRTQKRHADTELKNPTLFRFSVNGYSSICLQDARPSPALSRAGSDTATELCNVCVCVWEGERERECVCESQEARGVNSLHRNAQLSLGVFTSKHLLYGFGLRCCCFRRIFFY